MSVSARVPGPLHAATEDLIKLYLRRRNELRGYLEAVAFHVDHQSWQTLLMMDRELGIGRYIMFENDGKITWRGMTVKTLFTGKVEAKLPSGMGEGPVDADMIDPGMPQVLTIECRNQKTNRVVYVNHPDNSPEYS